MRLQATQAGITAKDSRRWKGLPLRCGQEPGHPLRMNQGQERKGKSSGIARGGHDSLLELLIFEMKARWHRPLSWASLTILTVHLSLLLRPSRSRAFASAAPLCGVFSPSLLPSALLPDF